MREGDRREKIERRRGRKKELGEEGRERRKKKDL